MKVRRALLQSSVSAQVVVLIVAAVVCGAVASALHPRGIPWVGEWARRVEALAERDGIPVVGLARVKELTDRGGGMILDARSVESYAAGHVPGALSLPRGTFYETLVGLELLLSREELVVAYCSGPECDDALAVALWLREQGFAQVALFVEGFEAWRRAGYPVEVGG